MQNIIHHYLGAKVKVVNKDGTTEIKEMNLRYLQGILAPSILTTVKSVTLLLHPLDQITIEQFKHVMNNIFDFDAPDDSILKQPDAIWARKPLTKERIRMSFYVENYNFIHFWTDFTDVKYKLAPPMAQIIKFVDWARSNSFDMDGLIESGYAEKITVA